MRIYKPTEEDKIKEEIKEALFKKEIYTNNIIKIIFQNQKIIINSLLLGDKLCNKLISLGKSKAYELVNQALYDLVGKHLPTSYRTFEFENEEYIHWGAGE